MKKVSYDKVEHTISTKGKKGSKQYAFKDFSNLIDLRDHMREDEPVEPKRKNRKKKNGNKIVKIVPAAGSMRINQTHIVIPCKPRKYKNKNGKVKIMREQVIVVNRYLTVKNVRNQYPNVMEMWYSIDDEVYGDRVVFANAR